MLSSTAKKGGHVCTLKMPDYSIDGLGSGIVGTITPLVNLWVNEMRLPCYMRAMPKVER